MARQSKIRRKNKRRTAKPKAAPATAYVLRLYITGQSSLSSASVRNLLRACQSNLEGQYDIQVIDICQQPELASEAQIIATPTLVRTHPSPIRKVIGSLADQKQLLAGLGIHNEKAN
jgi:circadian clock protein KaiB